MDLGIALLIGFIIITVGLYLALKAAANIFGRSVENMGTKVGGGTKGELYLDCLMHEADKKNKTLEEIKKDTKAVKFCKGIAKEAAQYGEKI